MSIVHTDDPHVVAHLDVREVDEGPLLELDDELDDELARLGLVDRRQTDEDLLGEIARVGKVAPLDPDLGKCLDAIATSPAGKVDQDFDRRQRARDDAPLGVGHGDLCLRWNRLDADGSPAASGDEGGHDTDGKKSCQGQQEFRGHGVRAFESESLSARGGTCENSVRQGKARRIRRLRCRNSSPHH